MNRRNFLKVLGIGGAVFAINPFTFIPEVNKYAHFNPKYDYGDWASVEDWIDKKSLRKIIKYIDRDQIAFTIPPQYRHKIHWGVAQPRPSIGDLLGERGFVSWRYSPRYDKQKITVF